MREQISENRNKREAVDWAKTQLFEVGKTFDSGADQVEQIFASSLKLGVDQKKEIVKMLREEQKALNRRLDDLVVYLYGGK